MDKVYHMVIECTRDDLECEKHDMGDLLFPSLSRAEYCWWKAEISEGVKKGNLVARAAVLRPILFVGETTEDVVVGRGSVTTVERVTGIEAGKFEFEVEGVVAFL